MRREAISKTRLIKDPYFLYVGNAYPHKNLEMLLKAFQEFSVHSSQFTEKIKLVESNLNLNFFEALLMKS